MIEVTTNIETFIEDDIEYTMKKYTIETNYNHKTIYVSIDELENQITTDDNGIGIISTFDTEEHLIEILAEEESFNDTL